MCGERLSKAPCWTPNNSPPTTVLGLRETKLFRLPRENLEFDSTLTFSSKPAPFETQRILITLVHPRHQYHIASAEMGSKTKLKGKQPSPSPSVSSEASSSASSSSSQASSSRSPLPANDDMNDASSTNSHSDEEEEEVSDELESVSSSTSSALPQPKIDLTKSRTKLHHVAKTLRATAKKTKTFELQKQVKKLKGLQKKPSLSAQAVLAEKELEALKSIDINLLAGRALITKMVKAKLLPRHTAEEGEGEWVYLGMVKEEELLGEVVLSDPVVTEGDKALERAKAKITSSKVLADEVGRFVDELRKLVRLETVGKKEEVEAKSKGKEKQKEDEAEEEDEEEREWSGSEEEDESEDEGPRRLPLVDDDDEEEEEDMDEEELERIGKEKMKALGDLSQWDDMIGSDSAAESGSDSDSESDEPEQRRTSKSKHQSNDSDASDAEDDSTSDSDSEDDSSSDSDSGSDASSSSSSSERPRKRKAKTCSPERSSKKFKKSSATSTFLPSLSTGFIAGRSDDEWSDAEADLADRDLSEIKSGGKKERKNRMGQRARKALYEKKYGKNANHIKMREKQKAAKLERSANRPPGARVGGGGDGSGRQRPPAFQAPTKRDGGWGGPVVPLPKQPKRPFVPRSEAPVPVVAPAMQNGGKPGAKAGGESKAQEMHPSWIAKQKQKELMAQVKPQGKKVVFD